MRRWSMLDLCTTRRTEGGPSSSPHPSGSEPVQIAYPGRIVNGRYELLERLGAGGMGTVWLADDRVLTARVAVKLHQGAADRAAVEAFLREASTATRVRHPAAVHVSDFGLTSEGVPFIVMEHLRGETLADRLGRGHRIEPLEAVRLLLPIAAALHAAHEAGITHGDVKPGNIVLEPRGALVQPRLLDFGIARTAEDFGSSRPIAGTPSYMSPEQAAGAPYGPRSDVWSFCVVLYEALSGVRLFRGGSASKALAKALSLAEHPLRKPPSVDGELWAIVTKGLRVDAADRWSSFAELGGALAMWATRRGASADASGGCLIALWSCDGNSAGIFSRSGPRVRTAALALLLAVLILVLAATAIAR